MGVNRRLQLRVVDSSEELYKLKQSWDEILSELTECPPFLTWEWMNTWWGVYKTNTTKLLVLVFSDNSKIVAIAPFYVRKSAFPYPCNTVYFLGTGEPESMEVCSEYLDIISLPSYSKAASNAVKSYFIENNRIWDRIGLERILKKSILLDVFIPDMAKEKHKVDSKQCGLRYYVLLPDQWDIYLLSIRSSMRRSIKVAKNRLLEHPDYGVEFLSKESEIDVYMQELIKLHSQSWHAKGKPGAFVSNEFRQFHYKIAKLFFKKNALQMLRINIANEVAGILYNFEVTDSVYYYQSGLNLQKFSSFKPGVLLHSEAIRNAINGNISKYDFMMAGEGAYKSQYGCETSEMFHISVWNKGLKAKLLQKLALLPYFNRAK